MAAINPQRIKGRWSVGVALDIQTISSTYVGVNEYGRCVYDTVRTELGSLFYRLKYRHDQSAIDEIVATAADYLRPARNRLDLIVPVPPSSERTVQPVLVMAQGIGDALGVEVDACIELTRPPTQLKNVTDPDQRAELVKGLYRVDPVRTANKRILLFDDLYRSGSTMNEITDVLLSQGDAARVVAFTITRSRRNT